LSKEKLAIDGGTPSIALGELTWPVASPEIVAAVNDSLADGSWGKYESRWTQEWIQSLEEYFSSANVMLCSSGTVAVELALRGLGVKPGDEVILAGYDFPGNFRAIEAIGAVPVLVDVVEDGWVIDPDQIDEALSEQTAAIVVSHLHGQVADVERIRELVGQWNSKSATEVKILEDVCQVPGGRINGDALGSFGDAGSLSFGGSKLLSAGRGGAILTNDASVFQRAKIFAQRGNDAFPLSQLQACVLGPQLGQLDSLTQIRAASVEALLKQTESLSDLIPLKQLVDNVVPAYYKVPWILKDRTPGWSRVDLIQALIAEGVPAGEGFRGFLRRSPRRCRKIGTLVNCQIAAQQTILLSHPILLQSDEVMKQVGNAIEKVVTNPR
jgi:dTDP-4-amino-4,6-dideoxygalactose transaminase